MMGASARNEREWHAHMLEFRAYGYDVAGWSTNTVRRYCWTVDRVDRWLRANRELPLRRAKVHDLAAFMGTLPPHPGSRNGVRSALAGYFDWQAWLGNRREDNNPAAELPRLKVTQPVPRALTAEQARAILAAARAHGREWSALVSLFLHAGLRVSEARTLQWRQWQNPFLQFREKGGADRLMPLHTDARSALHAWQGECTSAKWIFPSPLNGGHKPVSYNYVNRHLHTIGANAGVPELTAHVLRHTGATRLIELGVDLATVQQFLGHTKLSSTQIYLKVRPERLAGAVEQLDFTT